ncbi:hypothetical protein Ddc_21781 [Ditylenchus destructor]|nr:hypothetical protein Ddc_21781 [Ditylenchus destructor]
MEYMFYFARSTSQMCQAFDRGRGAGSRSRTRNPPPCQQALRGIAGRRGLATGLRGDRAAQKPGAEIFERVAGPGHADEFFGEKHVAPSLLGQCFQPRGNIDGGADDGEIEAGFRTDIAVHDITDMYADAVTQGIVALPTIDFIERNEAFLGAGDGFQQVFAGLGIAERENRQQPVAHEFQDFAAEFLDGIAHGVEITVQKLDDIVAWPEVGNMGEVAQVADQDRRAHRHAAAARRCAIEDLFTRMRPYIGLQQGARHAVFQGESHSPAPGRAKGFQGEDFRFRKAAGPVTGECGDMALAKGVFDRPGAIIRQPFGPQLFIDGIARLVDFLAGQPVADFGGALVNVADRAIEIFGRIFRPIAIGGDLGGGQAGFPQNARAKPLRMANAESEHAPRHGNSARPQPAAELDEYLVDKAFVLGAGDEPVENFRLFRWPQFIHCGRNPFFGVKA